MIILLKILKMKKVIEKPKTNDDNIPNVQYVSLGGNVYRNNKDNKNNNDNKNDNDINLP